MARTCEHESLGHDDGDCCEVCRLNAELDAERAHAAELKRRLDALAAEAYAYREALENEFPADVGTGYRAHTPKAISAVLSRPPGGTEALRAMLLKAWAEGERAVALVNPMNTYMPMCAQAETWIARLLGELPAPVSPQPDATKGGEG